MKRYQTIDHTADIGIVAFGKDLKEVFVNSAYAMFDIITEADAIKPVEGYEFSLSAENIEELLVTWLDELLFKYETERILFGDFKINSLDEKHIEAIAVGEKLDRSRHVIKTEIKNVTYHQLRIERVNDIWEAQIIFDV